MALRNPNVEVLAITTVAGNVPVQQASRNALYTVELCGSHAPVFAGAQRPLRRPCRSADWFHGRDGLGDCGYPPPNRQPEKSAATDAIIHTIESHPGLVLVTLGPLTNVALALQKRPEIAGNVSRCVIMGGAPCCEGNVTPAAEYNIWCDPDAARIVMRSGLPIELVGWHLCRGAAVLGFLGYPACSKLRESCRRVRRSSATACARKAYLCANGGTRNLFAGSGRHGRSLGPVDSDRRIGAFRRD